MIDWTFFLFYLLFILFHRYKFFVCCCSNNFLPPFTSPSPPFFGSEHWTAIFATHKQLSALSAPLNVKSIINKSFSFFYCNLLRGWKLGWKIVKINKYLTDICKPRLSHSLPPTLSLLIFSIYMEIYNWNLFASQKDEKKYYGKSLN